MPIVVEAPIRGHRQPVTESDLRRFLKLIPDWDRYLEGLHCLVLGDGDDDCFGWHWDGVICLHAWDSFEMDWDAEFFEEHQHVLDRLQVPYEYDEGHGATFEFTKKTACGFQLIHVFLHEVGHHYDRMQTKYKIEAPRGEIFAEGFGNRVADTMWTAFFREFGF